jgi:hypothetical protein
MDGTGHHMYMSSIRIGRWHVSMLFPPETDWKFETRLPNNKGMVLPSLPIEPTFIYELGQARAIVGYALRRDHPDIQLLAYERM